MLNALSIRDVVLIERLDLHFGKGLTALTGETGAGKSILLDSLGLALGRARRYRADPRRRRAGGGGRGLRRAPGHPALPLLDELGLQSGGEDIVLRRIVGRDGRSRALVNDQAVSVSLLKRLGALLIELQGQHEQVGLADPANHLALLDAFGVPAPLRGRTTAAFKVWKDTAERLRAAELAIAEAAREEDLLRHSVQELTTLAPRPGEEEAAGGGAAAAAIRRAAGRGDCGGAGGADAARPARLGPASHLRAAARALANLAAPDGAHPAAEALAAIERAEEALADAETLLNRLAHEAEDDPRALETTEERLFALRAAARKYAVNVAALPEHLEDLRARLASLETGAADIAALSKAAAVQRADMWKRRRRSPPRGTLPAPS